MHNLSNDDSIISRRIFTFLLKHEIRLKKKLQHVFYINLFKNIKGHIC